MIDKLRAGARRVWAQTFGRGSFGGRRWMRRTFITVVVVLVLFGLAGFVGVPLVAQYVVAGRLAASLHRPVSIEKVRFNPYRLRAQYRKAARRRSRCARSLHRYRSHPGQGFVELALPAGAGCRRSSNRTSCDTCRSDHRERFNFSDLLEPSGPTPTPTPSASAKPQRFSVSNIQIHEGEVHFDDKVLNQQHRLEHLELDVPFIANLPADVDIFVQPLLQMVVDGSPLRIAGKAKPFAVPPESVINLNLHQLSLPLYIGYVPKKLPLKLQQGTFSSLLQVHFVSAASAPEIRVTGEAAIDQLDVRDAANAPLAGFKHLAVVVTELKPLESVTHLGKIYLDGLTVHVVRNRDGTLNFTSLAAGKPPSPTATAPQALPSPAAMQTTPGPGAASLMAAKPSGALSPAAATQSAAPRPRVSATAAATHTATATPTPTATTTAVGATIAATATSPATPTITATITASATSAATPAAAAPAAATATMAATPTPAANTAQLTGNAPPAASRAPQPPPAPTRKPGAPADFSMEALELTNATIDVTDNSVAPPAVLTLRNLHVGVRDLRTVGQQSPAPFELATTLGGGGSIAVKGALDLAHSQAKIDITLAAIDLPALQGFAQSALAATVASGKLTAHANVQTLFATGKFNLHAAPASIALDKFELRAPGESVNPIGWNKLSASIGQVDLATHQATVTEVRSDGLHVFVRRERNGQLSLASLMRGRIPRSNSYRRRAPALARRIERPPQIRRRKGSGGKDDSRKPGGGRGFRPRQNWPRKNLIPVHERRERSTARRRRSSKIAARAPAAAPRIARGWRYQVASVALEKTEIRVEDDMMPRKVAICRRAAQPSSEKRIERSRQADRARPGRHPHRQRQL